MCLGGLTCCAPCCFDPITEGLPEGQRDPLKLAQEGAGYVGRIQLPGAARALPVLSGAASLTFSVTDRTAVQAP